jgi:hypothetical protein
MAQFGALQVVARVDGAAAAAQFRRRGYRGYATDQSALAYFTFAQAGLDHALVDLPPSVTSHQLADAKGSVALEALARASGAHLDAALASPTRRAEDLPWAYFRLATLAQAIDDRALLHRAVGDVESADAAAGGESGATAAARALEAVTAH